MLKKKKTITKSANTTEEKAYVGIDNHDLYAKTYIGILNTYKNQIEDSIKTKNELKKNFFSVIRIIMYILIAIFVISIIASFYIFRKMILSQYQSVSVIVGAITTVLSTFATMLVSIFKLPEIIAKYLFNKKEDQWMNVVIKNIQDYEIDMLRTEHETEYKAKLESTEDKAPALNQEVNTEASPNITGMQPQNADNNPITPLIEEISEVNVNNTDVVK